MVGGSTTLLISLAQARISLVRSGSSRSSQSGGAAVIGSCFGHKRNCRGMMALLWAGLRARRPGGREPAQQSIYHLPNMQQVVDRSHRPHRGLRRRALTPLDDLGLEVGPLSGDQGARAVRQDQRQVDDASPPHLAGHGEKLSHQGMALPRDPHLGWRARRSRRSQQCLRPTANAHARVRALDAGSVRWCPLIGSITTN